MESLQQLQPYAFPSGETFPTRPRLGTPFLKDGAMFIYMHVEGKNVWLPFGQVAPSIVKTFADPTDPWKIYHKFETITGVTTYINDEIQDLPTRVGSDGDGNFVEAFPDVPTAGTIVISGIYPMSAGVEAVVDGRDLGSKTVAEVQALIDNNELMVGDYVHITDTGTLSYGPDKTVDLEPDHQVTVNQHRDYGDYGVTIVDLSAPAPIVEAMIAWSTYTYPPEINEYYTAGDTFSVYYPNMALASDASRVALVEMWTVYGEYSGTEEVPLVFIRNRDGDLWTEQLIFYPSITTPRNEFEVLNVEFSPNNQWMVVAGEDRDGRASAMIFERVGGTFVYRQFIIGDDDMILYPETDHVPLVEPGRLSQFGPVSGLQIDIDEGRLEVGDRKGVIAAGTVTVAPGITVELTGACDVLVTEKNGPGDYRIHVNYGEFISGGTLTVTDDYFIIAHAFCPPTATTKNINQHRYHIYKRDAGNVWTQYHSVTSGRITDYASWTRAAAASHISPDGQTLYVYDGDVVGTGGNGATEFGNICIFNNTGVGFEFQEKLSFDATYQAQYNGGEYGWQFDVSDDNSTLVLLNNSKRLLAFKRIDGLWTLTCVSHVASADPNASGLQDPPADASLVMPTPFPAPYAPVDYVYNTYGERKIALSPDGTSLIVSAHWDWIAGTAMEVSVSESGLLSFVKAFDSFDQMTEDEIWDVGYDRYSEVDCGNSGRIVAAHACDYTGNTSGETYIRY